MNTRIFVASLNRNLPIEFAKHIQSSFFNKGQKMQANIFESKYNPQGAGILYSTVMRAPKEEAAFTGSAEKPADLSMWQQDWRKFTYSQDGYIVHQFANQGAGKTMSAELTKAPDFQTKTFTLTHWPAIGANAKQGVLIKNVHYANARGVYFEKFRREKVASAVMFSDDYHQRYLWMELLGCLQEWKDQIGLCYNEERLIDQSGKPSITIAPWLGNFPFQHQSCTGFNVGTIGSFKIVAESQNRPMSEMIITNFIGDASGLFVVPRNLADDTPLTADAIQSILAVKYVWVDENERTLMNDNYREIKYKHMLLAGETTVDPTTKAKPIDIPLECRGEATQILLTVQADSDLESGKWLKTCDEKSGDFINGCMLFLNDKAAEDGLPAQFYRTANIIDSWKVTPNRHVYLVSVFDTNPHSPYFSGGRILSPYSKLKLVVDVKPTKESLHLRADYIVWNNWVRLFSIRLTPSIVHHEKRCVPHLVVKRYKHRFCPYLSNKFNNNKMCCLKIQP